MSSSSDLFKRIQLFRSSRGGSAGLGTGGLETSGLSSSADGGGQQRLSDEEDLVDEHPNIPRIDPASSGVKRCLFGPGNTEENIKFAKRELEKSLLESSQKWNFDFASEKPLDGRYQWHNSRQLPYSRPKNVDKNVGNVENVENLRPLEHPSSKHTSSSASSSDSNFDEQVCDLKSSTPTVWNVATSTTTATTTTTTAESLTTTSTSEEPSASGSSQRNTSRRQSSITEIYRQRKRSKSKVKVQERKNNEQTNNDTSDTQLTNIRVSPITTTTTISSNNPESD